MHFLGKTGPIVVTIIACLPIYFWLPFASFINTAAILRSIGQATALVGTILICINFILAARFLWIEKLFSGLNRVYIVHAFVGAIGFILILIHPTTILLSYLNISLGAAIDLLIPSVATIPIYFGISALVVMIILLFLTLYIPIDYDSWKKTHQYLGLVLLLAAIHALLVGSTLASSLALRVYIYTFFIAGSFSFLYKLFSRKLGIYRHKFIVETVSIAQEATIVQLKPVTKMLTFFPGQFAFIRVQHRGISNDSHPFSISSDPKSPLLSFAIKSLGDYTETLKLLTPGTPIEVEGPFGRFSYHYYKKRNQLWIAGGIGITPFMSMLRSLQPNHGYFITFIYCVKDRAELLFAQELHALQSTIPNVHIHFWVSSEMGRLTGDTVAKLILNLQKQEIFVCGPPPMMHALRKSFIIHRVPKRQIHTEEFSLN